MCEVLSAALGTWWIEIRLAEDIRHAGIIVMTGAGIAASFRRAVLVHMHFAAEAAWSRNFRILVWVALAAVCGYVVVHVAVRALESLSACAIFASGPTNRCEMSNLVALVASHGTLASGSTVRCEMANLTAVVAGLGASALLSTSTASFVTSLSSHIYK